MIDYRDVSRPARAAPRQEAKVEKAEKTEKAEKPRASVAKLPAWAGPSIFVALFLANVIQIAAGCAL
jgi:hypothetical protein